MQSINKNGYSKERWQQIVLFLLIVALAVGHILYINENVWPLNGDEAQYWNWSKNLAFGYYSKPPFLAWLIAITTGFLGNGLLGIRFGAIICHSVTAIFMYLSGKRLYDHQIGFWSAISYLLLPGVSFSAGIISTDPPLLTFWTMAFYFFLRAIERNQLGWWLAMGVAVGFGMLSKYAAIFFPISVFIYLLTTSNKRSLLSHPGFYLSLLLACLILVPNIVWNAHHHFASVHAVEENADLGGGNFFQVNNLLLFLVSQAALLGPILFVVLSYHLLGWRKVKQDNHQQLLLTFVWPLLLVMLLEAFLSRAHGNWAVPIYITGVIAACALLIQNKKLKWLIAANIINCIVFVGLFQAPLLIRTMQLKLPLHTTMLNWPKIGQEIAKQKIEHPQSFLLVDDRMLLTLSMYYGEISLAQAVKWNPSGVIHDQYDLQTDLMNKMGKSFILVTYQAYPMEIMSHFSQVKFLMTLQQSTLDGRTTNVYLFYLEDFLGYPTYNPYARELYSFSNLFTQAVKASYFSVNNGMSMDSTHLAQNGTRHPGIVAKLLV